MLCHRRSRSHLRGGAGGRLSRFLCHFPWQVENAPSVLTEVQAPLAPYPQLLSSRGSEEKPGVHSRSPGRGWGGARGGDEGVLGAAGGARWAPGVLAAPPPLAPRRVLAPTRPRAGPAARVGGRRRAADIADTEPAAAGGRGADGSCGGFSAPPPDGSRKKPAAAPSLPAPTARAARSAASEPGAGVPLPRRPLRPTPAPGPHPAQPRARASAARPPSQRRPQLPAGRAGGRGEDASPPGMGAGVPRPRFVLRSPCSRRARVLVG